MFDVFFFNLIYILLISPLIKKLKIISFLIRIKSPKNKF